MKEFGDGTSLCITMFKNFDRKCQGPIEEFCAEYKEKQNKMVK